MYYAVTPIPKIFNKNKTSVLWCGYTNQGF